MRCSAYLQRAKIVGKIGPEQKYKTFNKRSLVANKKFAYIGIVVNNDSEELKELNPNCNVWDQQKYRVKIIDGWDSDKTHKGDQPAEFIFPNPTAYASDIAHHDDRDTFEPGQVEYRNYDIVKHEDLMLLDLMPESYITKSEIDNICRRSDKRSFGRRIYTVENSVDGLDFINTLQYIGEIKYSDKTKHFWNLSVRMTVMNDEKKSDETNSRELTLKQFNLRRRIDTLGLESRIVNTLEATNPINDIILKSGDAPFYQRNLHIQTETDDSKREEYLNAELVFFSNKSDDRIENIVPLWPTENQFHLDPLEFQVSSVPTKNTETHV